MEKFSRFRDKGTGVSPFVPITTPTSSFTSAVHWAIFLLRLPLFISYFLLYFIVLHHLSLPAVVRKLLLWGLMAVPGIWWVDLRIDGVKRGHLAQQAGGRVPHARSIIAANFTSPIDALYLAAVFDPIFTTSYPGTHLVTRISLLGAMWHALSRTQLHNHHATIATDDPTAATDLRALLNAHPDRVIVVFPECATTNGKAILPLSPSLLTVPPDVSIFPVCLRYTPADITTPVPDAFRAFFWNLLSRPTHCIRVRIAQGVPGVNRLPKSQPAEGDAATPVSVEEQRLLDKVADDLARLGMSKRVALTLESKAAFIRAWEGRK